MCLMLYIYIYIHNIHILYIYRYIIYIIYIHCVKVTVELCHMYLLQSYQLDTLPFKINTQGG